MIFLNYIIKYFVRFISILIVFYKLENIDLSSKKILPKVLLFSLVISIIFSFLKINNLSNLGILISLIFIVIFLIVLTQENVKETFIKLLFCYVLILSFYFLFCSLFVGFISLFIFNNESPTFIDFRMGDFLQLLFVTVLMNKKKFRKGFYFFKQKVMFKEMSKTVCIISIFLLVFLILFEVICELLVSFDSLKTCIFFIIFALCIFLIYWIKHEVNNHLKSRANERTINNLLTKVEEQEAKIERLILDSKVGHKINHQLDVLKSKFIDGNYEELLKEFNDLSNNYRNSISKINKKNLLQSSNVDKVDDVLVYFLNEAYKENIDLVIKVNGSVNYMVKNIIDEDKLTTLLSDHLKNSMISIRHSDNPFRCITLNIGVIGNYYGLAIHDTGIEFEINTLVNLGVTAITTHKEDGGTGIGFLTTFDTLNEYKASLVITENEPADYNYTKVINIIFDDNNEFKINSYRTKEISDFKINNNLVINKANNKNI